MADQLNTHEAHPVSDAPVLSWEEVEAGQDGQLPLPITAQIPTVGERTFLALARRWHDQLEQEGGAAGGSRSTDELELSCLVLAVDGGREFTAVAESQILSNEQMARANPSKRLLWGLCRSLVNQAVSHPLDDLIAGLGHHSSSVRNHMVGIGWIMRTSLDASRAVPVLLKNLADTLGGPFESAGLAAALIRDEDEFWTVARTFRPPPGFEDQYEDRLQLMREEGVLLCQAPLWELEAESRRRVCLEATRQRLVPPRKELK
jgi:hypothetical protein